MAISLRRTRDGAGDSGPMSMLLRRNPETDEIECQEFGRPTVGWAIRVGSINGRTFGSQDWWQTTYITEILEDTPNMVRFKTGNSEYVWKDNY